VQSRFRLTRSEDFKRVRQSGKSYAHPLVVLVAQPNQSQNIRVGVTAGKTVGTAVARNRAKRLLREVMRPMLPSLASGWDLILVARPKLVTASLEVTQNAVTTLLHRAKLIPSNGS
jgi:ribonuclease P protein component